MPIRNIWSLQPGECITGRIQSWALKKLFTEEFFQKLCNELWGKEVTFQELKSLLESKVKANLHFSLGRQANDSSTNLSIELI